LYTLEQLARADTMIHRLHPLVKLIGAAVFIVTVVSFRSIAFGRMLPYIFYPTLLAALSETPYAPLYKRFLLALPFCVFAGVSNIFFSREPIFFFAGWIISAGWASFFSLLLRAYLCVMAVLLLVSTTPITALTDQMRRLKIPSVFVTMFEILYRYLGVLMEEGGTMYTACLLRSRRRNGVSLTHAGSLIGQLLLRSLDRGQRVYAAMKCRGYGQNHPTSKKKLQRGDVVFLFTVCPLCLAFRWLDVGVLWVFVFSR
jgi:cobalt/nickel transport system permease protein